MQNSLNRADPYQAVINYFHENGDFLELQEERIPLGYFDRFILLAVGKAAIPMAKATVDHFGEKIYSGVVIYKNEDKSIIFPNEMKIRMVKGDHPIPEENSLRAGEAVLDLLQQLQPSDLLLALISGGGSALLAAPIEGVTLQGIHKLTRELIASGASIQEMNVIRKHLDRVKGGGVLKLNHNSKVLSLIVSDVIGNDTSSIASGITATDDSTFAQAIQVVKKFRLEKNIDPAIWEYLNSGVNKLHEETLKSSDSRELNVNNQIILSNSDCILAGEEYARKISWKVISGNLAYTGEAREIGKEMARTLVKMAEKKKVNSKPIVSIYGGEPTVHVYGKGKGGRNLELALSAIESLDGARNVALVSFSTDGEDGPTDAAGAIITGETVVLAKRMGLNPRKFLAENDSYHFFEKVGGLIKTGPTGTNVNDLVFLIAF